MESGAVLTCPFCGLEDDNDYQMLLHVEISHSENGDSPFVVKDSRELSSGVGEPLAGALQSARSDSPVPSVSGPTYVDCPHKCGERIPTAELQSHADFHMAENMALEDSAVTSALEMSTGACNDDQAIKDLSDTFTTSISTSIRNHGQLTRKPPPESERRKTPSLRELFFGSPARKRVASHATSSKSGRIKRLGTAELGPYAHEPRMPMWLQKMLEEGAKVTIYNKIGPNGVLIRVEAIENETPDLVPVLARLSAADRSVARAFYCSPEVRHVVKMPREGGFCGYRNIQMLVSYIRDAKAPGYQHFSGRLPSIIKLQDMIEDAWTKGFNSTGKIETGGIKYTRKYIGTPEAQALFLGLDISCEAVSLSSGVEDDAYTTLMTVVMNYFEDEETKHEHHRVVITTKPPIYFQHRGHSMTIVGIEVHKNGSANLVVFDPMFKPSPSVKKLVDAASFRLSDPGRLLKAHRRGESYLLKYKEFELLKVQNGDEEPDSSKRRDHQQISRNK